MVFAWLWIMSVLSGWCDLTINELFAGMAGKKRQAQFVISTQKQLRWHVGSTAAHLGWLAELTTRNHELMDSD